MTVSFIAGLFLNGAMSMLWNILNTLQLIVALQLLKVTLPVNVVEASEIFDQVANF
jgi:hypothetical protein